MKTADRRRKFQLESLEDRSLLSMVVPHPAAEVGSIHAEKVRVVSGQISGKVTSTTPISPIEFMVTVKGTGTAKGYGPVSLTATYPILLNPATPSLATIPSGTGTLTSAKFGKAFLAYSGFAVFSATQANIALTGTVPVLTGVFAGGTGTFTANGTVNLMTGKGHLTFHVVLNTPK
jgi:hypothetical protein